LFQGHWYLASEGRYCVVWRPGLTKLRPSGAEVELVNLLGIDTSTLRAALALERDDGARFASTSMPGRRHGRDLIPSIRNLLDRAGLQPGDLTAIDVGIGPGSYTGLRVGVMAAKTLAYATGASLHALDSLEFFARATTVEAPRVSVLSDAQRGDFHVADFLRSSPAAPLLRQGPIRIESQEELVASWVEPRIVVGPGLSKWQGEWPNGIVASPEADEPDPCLLLDMLKDALKEGRQDNLGNLEPLYLRRSAAEDQWEKKR
jgi:tRNA threonylcarbamoyladenosine biosynthesis protein TsaB